MAASVNVVHVHPTAGSDSDVVVVLQDYPSSEIGRPIYRIGEKLQLIAQYGRVFNSFFPRTFERWKIVMRKLKKRRKTVEKEVDGLPLHYREASRAKGQLLIPLFVF